MSLDLILSSPWNLYPKSSREVAWRSTGGRGGGAWRAAAWTEPIDQQFSVFSFSWSYQSHTWTRGCFPGLSYAWRWRESNEKWFVDRRTRDTDYALASDLVHELTLSLKWEERVGSSTSIRKKTEKLLLEMKNFISVWKECRAIKC